MNLERLLQHFDRIAEAPDAIPRLRQFILDLAVRGKLVEQDPKDKSALSQLALNDQARKETAQKDRRKVDELMVLCDQLEAQLTTTESDSRRLLEAALNEALNGCIQVTR